MKKFLSLVLIFSSFLIATKYLDNRACSECHDRIYQEYQSSAHAMGYFNDELHQKIANRVDKKSYKCASCHMPMATYNKNFQKIIPNRNSIEHKDAISCYFCHTIAYKKNPTNKI